MRNIITAIFILFVSTAFGQYKSMRVTVTADGILQDEVLVQFGVNFTNAGKFNNYFENMAISRNGRYWSVERRPELIAADTTFLSFYGKRLDHYKLTFSPSLPAVNVMLKYNGKEYGLSSRDTVSLDLAFAEDTSRLMIIYSIPGPKPLTYPNPVYSDTFIVSGLAAGKYMFRVFDQAGKFIYAKSQDVTDGRASLQAKMKKGIYYINIQKSGAPQQIISVVKD